MPTAHSPRPGVLVTGAAGFLGRHVVEALVQRGHRVTGLDRRAWVPCPGEDRVVTDLLDAEAAPLLARADAVVHLAGCPGVRDDRPDSDRWRWRDNVLAGERVLATAAASTPLVVASSSSVYGGAGAATSPSPCHEEDPRRPRGGYARSKAALEDLCRARADAGGHVAVLRPFTVAGEGQRPDMALARWIAAARTGAAVQVFGSLARRRDVTDVRMVAEVFCRALETGLTGTCNVGTGRTHTLATMLDAVAEAVGRHPPVEVVPAAVEEVPTTMADTRRLAARLGVVPTTDLYDLVARQAASTRELVPA